MIETAKIKLSKLERDGIQNEINIPKIDVMGAVSSKNDAQPEEVDFEGDCMEFSFEASCNRNGGMSEIFTEEAMSDLRYYEISNHGLVLTDTWKYFEFNLSGFAFLKKRSIPVRLSVLFSNRECIPRVLAVYLRDILFKKHLPSTINSKRERLMAERRLASRFGEFERSLCKSFLIVEEVT